MKLQKPKTIQDYVAIAVVLIIIAITAEHYYAASNNYGASDFSEQSNDLNKALEEYNKSVK